MSLPREIGPGSVVDGFELGACVHRGANAALYRALPPADRDPGFPVVMKVPAMGPGEATLGLVCAEAEQTILPRLNGSHVPRFVAAGDLEHQPYVAMEWIEGAGLAGLVAGAPLAAGEVARIGAAVADALHEVHRQHVIHFDLKPENVLLRADGSAVLVDFGFARHAHLPDLLAEELDFAAGSAAYVSPEQLRQDRTDARSDLFALGVMLYELATGEVPFGEPATLSGLRDRLWRAPLPPRARHPDVPPWLQEIVLHALEVEAARRYGSAALVAFDLRHPEQVTLTPRAAQVHGPGATGQIARWWRSLGGTAVTAEATGHGTALVIMVALDTEHADDERHRALQAATQRLLSAGGEMRLLCVSAIHAAPLGASDDPAASATGRHLEHRARLRHWIGPLGLPPERLSLHVVESARPADTLLELARANHVDLIVLGAPDAAQHALAWWRSVASAVTARAPCSVHVVRVRHACADAPTAEGRCADEPPAAA